MSCKNCQKIKKNDRYEDPGCFRFWKRAVLRCKAYRRLLGYREVLQHPQGGKEVH